MQHAQPNSPMHRNQNLSRTISLDFLTNINYLERLNGRLIELRTNNSENSMNCVHNLRELLRIVRQFRALRGELSENKKE